MLYKAFLKYWKISTWYVKPIGPYYRWLWRSPGKKFLIMGVISTISVIWQFKMLDKWLAKGREKELQDSVTPYEKAEAEIQANPVAWYKKNGLTPFSKEEKTAFRMDFPQFAVCGDKEIAELFGINQ